MKDNVSVERLQKLHPKCKDVFKKFIEESEEANNVILRITQGLRTFEEQQALYEQGRSKPGSIVTNSQAGQSYHCYGLAVDLVAMVNGRPAWEWDMSKLKPIATKYGIGWGGDFKSIKDKPHFELTYGHKWQDLLALHGAGKVDSDGYVLLT